MASLVYILGVLTTFCCALLLLRAYTRTRQKLLLWSGFCFIGLTLSNFLIVVDLVIFPDVSLYRWRLAAAAISMLLLLYGLIWEIE